MSSEFSCLVCKGAYFKKGYYDLDLDTSIYSTAYNNATITGEGNVSVHTDIYNDVHTTGDLDFRVYHPEKNDSSYSCVYKYACEDCGYIMSFTKEKKVECKHEEKKREEKENAFDWSAFGPKK
ncbi:hypothetical protein [Priestia koreensis]|uniref:hypothetical protein n=1 Tax=Priestia koreensis TaxID=284581 RepID=UPI0006A9A5C8|nr:hypothetical protein [Priestia koreensis]